MQDTIDLQSAMKKVETLSFVDRVFDTFAWRSQPQEIWDEDHYNYDYYNNGFDPVPPREFDFNVFESHPFHSQGDRLYVMTVEGYLYYMPSFIALILEDVDRTNGLGHSVLGSLRSHPPYIGPISDWVSHLQEQPPLVGSPEEIEELEVHWLVESIKEWFVEKVHPSQCEHISNMTELERKIVAQFLDKLVLNQEFADEANQIHSVQSVLRNETYIGRLGAFSESDITELLLLIDTATKKYSAHFPSQLYDSIRNRLKQSKDT